MESFLVKAACKNASHCRAGGCGAELADVTGHGGGHAGQPVTQRAHGGDQQARHLVAATCCTRAARHRLPPRCHRLPAPSGAPSLAKLLIHPSMFLFHYVVDHLITGSAEDVGASLVHLTHQPSAGISFEHPQSTTVDFQRGGGDELCSVVGCKYVSLSGLPR